MSVGGQDIVFPLLPFADIKLLILISSAACYQFYISGAISWSSSIDWLQDPMFRVYVLFFFSHHVVICIFIRILDRLRQVLLDKCHVKLQVKSGK